MIAVTVLGSSAALPPPHRGHTALVVTVGSSKTLLECGPSILAQLQRAGHEPATIDRLFVSHLHGDHSLGFPLLLLARKSARCRRPLDVFCPATAADGLRTLVRTAYADVAEKLEREARFVPLDPHARTTVDLGPGLTLAAFPMRHSIDVLSVRLEAGGGVIVYSGDTGPTPGFAEFAHGADVLLHEATFCAALDPAVGPATHSSARQAGEAARDAGVRVLVLVHMHERHAGRESALIEEARTVFGGAIVAPTELTVIPVGATSSHAG